MGSPENLDMKQVILLIALALATPTLSVPVDGSERVLDVAGCLALQAGKTLGADLLPFGGFGAGLAADLLCKEILKPKEPELSKIPGLPELPKIPGLPELPKIPGLPERPKIPGLPEIPKVPELPEIPKIPELPEIPKIPGLPEIPDIPDSGKGKYKGKDDKGKDHGKGKDKGKDDHKKGKDKGKDKGKGKGPFGLF